LDEFLPPLLNLAGQIQRLGMRLEILDTGCFVDGCLVGPELFQEFSDILVVFELETVEEIEDDDSVERSAFVRIDEGMIGDEEAEEVKCLLVDRLWSCIERSLLDVVQRELDITTVLDAAWCGRILGYDIVVDGEDILDLGIPHRIRHSLSCRC